jgi:glycosyltransferase involved in cell wall biosynthesis
MRNRPPDSTAVRAREHDMRIVHIITRLIVGGAQENTILSCEGLQARGHEVTLLSGPTTGPEGSLVERAQSGDYAFRQLPNMVRRVSPLHDTKAYFVLRRLLEESKPDVVHTHSSKAGVLGRLAAHHAGVPVIVHTIHGMSFNRTQPLFVRTAFAMAERLCAEKCHALVSVADAMTRQAQAAGVGRPEQFETIRSGIIVDDFDPAAYNPSDTRRHWGIDDQSVVVGTVARLFRNKGYEQLIEIIAQAAAAEPRLRFVWFGDGADRGRYECELRERGLDGLVTIAGLVPPAQMPQVLAGIDILAHTSQWEGLPRAVVQALLMEKPVVSFAIDGAPEVVEPGATGELAELNDNRAFAAALVALARDASRRSAYGAAGRQRCLAEFGHHAMVEKLEALYQRLRP